MSRDQKLTPRMDHCLLTGFHHMVHGGEPLEHSRADRAEDEQGRQAGVAHHGASEQAASLVAPLEAPWQDAHEPVGQRDAGVLAPPPVHHQGHVETWKKAQAHINSLTHGYPWQEQDQVNIWRFHKEATQIDLPSTKDIGMRLE